MIALDTNVVVRIVTRDHIGQLEIAHRAIADDMALVTLTVLIEAEWVLRRAFGLSRAEVNAAFRLLHRYPGIVFERAAAVGWALSRHADGADFADMAHLIGGQRCEAFATFDRALAGQAGPDAPVPVRTLG